MSPKEEKTPQAAFFESLLDCIEENVKLEDKLSLKELLKCGGIYAELGNGRIVTQYFDKKADHIMPVLFLCKKADQMRCIEYLSRICNYLTTLKQYPQGENFRWSNAVTVTEPHKSGRDTDGQYVYACMVECRVYF